jgi:predicted LPLAT superfamily acyltransferase
MDFDPEILVRLHWQGTPVEELVTRVHYPEQGHSNFHVLKDNALISLMHVRLVAGMLLRLPRLIGRRYRAGNDAAGGHWAAFAERGTLIGLRFMLLVYRLFGRWLFRPVAYLVAAYFTLRAGPAREASREYLDRVWTYGQGRSALPHAPDRWTTLAHFHAFTEAILDKIAAWRGDIRYEQIDHENLELFEARRAAGAGGIWITSHLGNIEVCRAIGRQEREFQLTVLMHTRHAANFNRLLAEVAPASHVELLEVSEFNLATALRLSERIARGGFVVVVADRVPLGDSARVVRCPFLGRPAEFPLGPFLLATLLGCPAGTLFCVRDGARFRLVIDDLPGLAGVSRQHRQAAIEAAVATYAGRLESLCLRYPLQWFNFFPFWPDRRDDA